MVGVREQDHTVQVLDRRLAGERMIEDGHLLDAYRGECAPHAFDGDRHAPDYADHRPVGRGRYKFRYG
jgi:hypothetical protein